MCPAQPPDATCGWKIYGGSNIGPNPPCLDDSFWQRHFWNQCESHIGNPEVMPYKSNQLLSFRIGHPTVDAVDSPHLQMSTGKNHPFWDTPLWLKNCTSSAAVGFTWFYIFIFIHVPLSCICSIPMFSHTLRSMIFPDVPNMNFTIFQYFSIVFQVPLHWVPLAMRARLGVISGLPYPAKGINPMFKVRKSITTKEYFKIQRPQSKWHPNHKLNDSQICFKITMQ